MSTQAEERRSASPNQLPIINVVAILVILLSAMPVYLAQRLTSETAVLGSR